MKGDSAIIIACICQRKRGPGKLDFLLHRISYFSSMLGYSFVGFPCLANQLADSLAGHRTASLEILASCLAVFGDSFAPFFILL